LFAIKATIIAAQQDVSAIKAMQLFDNGNYIEAEKLFRLLLNEDPGNPMLNYYYGASRTENGQFGENDLNYLLQAGKNVTPDRLNYYLGMQHHARGNWEQAVRYYNQFRLSVPENEQQKLGLAEKIQQCFDQVNPFEEDFRESKKATDNQPAEDITVIEQKQSIASDFPSADIQKNDSAEVILKETKQEHSIHPPVTSEPDSLYILAEIPELTTPGILTPDRAALPDLPGVKSTYSLPPGEPIEFRVNNNITYLFDSQFKTENGKELFERAVKLRKEMNDKLEEVEQFRKIYGNISEPEEKSTIAEKIVSLEMETYHLQEEASAMFTSVRNMENEYWNNAENVEVHNFLTEQEKIKTAISEKTKEETEAEEDFALDSLPESFLEIYDLKPATSSGRQADQLVYKIQIGAYSRGVPAYRQRLYNKLALIRKIDSHTDEKGVVVYTTGNLSNLEDAEKMRNQVKQEGIQDAIVVPYFNGKRITLEQAKKIEAGNDIERN
jgi:tetratricopeptide (TPR) repeat protein